MDFSAWIGKSVKIDISANYYYSGKVVDADDKFLSLIDKNGKHVTLSIDNIQNIREISNGK